MSKEHLTNVVVGFAIAVLILGFILGIGKDKPEHSDYDDTVDTRDSPHLYQDEDLEDGNSDENENESEEINNQNQLDGSEEIEEKVKKSIKDIDDVDDYDTGFIDYKTEYSTLYTENANYSEEDVDKAVLIMHEIVKLQFDKQGGDLSDWEKRVTDNFLEKFKSGNYKSVIYGVEQFMTESTVIENDSDFLVIGGITSDWNGKSYLHIYKFRSIKGEIKLDDIKLAWRT